MFILALLIFVCILTYAFEIVFGLAGTIMMLMIMGYFMDMKTLVIYSVLPQILVAAIGLIRSPKTINLAFLSKMLAFAAVGAVLGLYLFYYLSAGTFDVLLASTISLFGLVLVISPGRMGLHPLAARGFDTLSGLSQALFGISGPIAMTRLLSTFDHKTVVRNYALAFFLPLNLFRAGAYVFNQTITPEIGHMMLISAPFLIVSLWFANHLHFKVNERLFRRVVAWVILLGGLSLFFGH